MENYCSEDYLFNCQAFARAERVVHIPDILYRAVQSADSFSRSALNQKKITAIQADLERVSTMRPDLMPEALERLICICGELSLDARAACTMPYRDARKQILFNANKAAGQALKMPGTRTALPHRQQWINIYFPALHGFVDDVYRRFLIR